MSSTESSNQKHFELFIGDKNHEIRELLCPKDELNRTVEHVPTKYKTLRLYYLDVKNAVCKPMQW